MNQNIINFDTYIYNYFTKWFDFKSRSTRSEYWWIYLTLLLILIIEIIINSLIN